MYNPGFMIVNPSLASLMVFRTMSVYVKERPHLHEQPRMYQVVKELKEQNFPIKARFLDEVKFTHGPPYFYEISSLLPKEDDPCISTNKSNCPVIVLHNTCILTKAAKIYRFREHLMWLYDGKDKYYSSKTRKYITFTNQKPASLLSQIQLTKLQVSTLRTALAIGYIINRVVLLPKFHCKTSKSNGLKPCPLNSLIRIGTFDSFFSGQYRESSFLWHPLVPQIVKQSSKYQQLVSHNSSLSSTSSVYTVTSDNVSSVYRGLNDSVINCGNLEGIRIIFRNYSNSSEFQTKIRKAFKLSVYNQFTSGALL